MKAKFFHFIKNSFNFKEKIKEFSKIEYFKRKKNLIIQKIKKNFKLVFWVSYPFLGGFWVWVWNPKSKPKPKTFWVWMHDVQPIKVPHPNSINKNYDIVNNYFVNLRDDRVENFAFEWAKHDGFILHWINDVTSTGLY